MIDKGKVLAKSLNNCYYIQNGILGNWKELHVQFYSSELEDNQLVASGTSEVIVERVPLSRNPKNKAICVSKLYVTCTTCNSFQFPKIPF